MRGGPGDIFVNIAGDEMTGALILQNDVPLSGRDTTGAERLLIKLSPANRILVGDNLHPLYLLNNGDIVETVPGAEYPVWTRRSLPIVCKTADETVNNSITLQTDDELSLPVTANSVWVVHFYLWVTTTATALFRANISVPTGADYDGTGYEGSSSAISPFYSGWDLITAYNGKLVFLQALIRVGANAGTVHLLWAQKTAEASDTVVEADSSMVAIRTG